MENSLKSQVFFRVFALYLPSVTDVAREHPATHTSRTS